MQMIAAIVAQQAAAFIEAYCDVAAQEAAA